MLYFLLSLLFTKHLLSFGLLAEQKKSVLGDIFALVFRSVDQESID